MTDTLTLRTASQRYKAARPSHRPAIRDEVWRIIYPHFEETAAKGPYVDRVAFQRALTNRETDELIRSGRLCLLRDVIDLSEPLLEAAE